MPKKLEILFLEKREAQEQTARGQIFVAHKERLPSNPLYTKVEHQKMYTEYQARTYGCNIVALPSQTNISDKEIWYCRPKKSN